MANDGDDPDDAAAEELLWSLGVGAELPAWLKAQRTEEIRTGLRRSHLPSRGQARQPWVPSAQVVPRSAEMPCLSVVEWLECVDDSGYLAQHVRRISAYVDSGCGLAALIESCQLEAHQSGAPGSTARHFFEDCGITKLGHRRLFEKWFRESRPDKPGRS